MFLILLGIAVFYISWIIFIIGIVCTGVGAVGSIVILWNMTTYGYNDMLLLYLLLAASVTIFGIFCLEILWPKSKKKQVKETVQHFNTPSGHFPTPQSETKYEVHYSKEFEEFLRNKYNKEND